MTTPAKDRSKEKDVGTRPRHPWEIPRDAETEEVLERARKDGFLTRKKVGAPVSFQPLTLPGTSLTEELLAERSGRE
jgi:hypothetical protein